ncbi:unnamed protein product [Chironomus riparius]|uniref:DUF1308 domain-containing protein n=1 Tax=Chironomus riparius TaxID=315576 RepID=A0A9N9S5M9_9DIPT|nr:unnamed protein product [Chironomus riparius]
MEDPVNIELLIEEKVNLALELIDKLESNYSKVDGAIKTKRSIEKEMKFLQKLKSVNDIESVRRQLHCTNLNFYSHLVNSLDRYSKYHKVSAIAQVKRRNSDDKAIRIDIVCDDSNEVLWIKIIARNSESIIDEVMGRCEYGCKDVLEVGEEYLDIALDTEVNFFRPPKVIFDFLNPVDESIENELEENGIILGRKYQACESLRDDQQVSKTLNVDVSTMLAYISELSNGGINYKFDEQLLEDQVAVERKEPIKPVLDKIFDGKKLIACETAVKSFDEIIKLLAGPNETRRAEEFKSRITVLTDVEHPEEIINLDLSAQIKERSRKIFAFGIFHKAVTASSNCGFKRAAKMKNLDIPIINHSARALSELKQREKIDT